VNGQHLALLSLALANGKLFQVNIDLKQPTANSQQPIAKD